MDALVCKRVEKLLKSLSTGCIDQNLKFILWLQKSAVTENIGQKNSIRNNCFFIFLYSSSRFGHFAFFLVKEVGLKDIAEVVMVVNVVEVMDMVVVMDVVGSGGGGDCLLGFGWWLWL